MKVLYFGSDVFLSCFTYFLQNHHIEALYTYHNDEDYIAEYSIKKLAEENGIPIHYESITPEILTQYFAEKKCDLVFSAEYNRKIPIPENMPQFRGINVHSSLLPQGRSYYPIEAAMERGLTRTGVTLHKLEPTYDTGAIIAQKGFDLTPRTSSIDVYLRCAEYARQLLEEIMQDFEAAWANARVQTEILPAWKRPDTKLLTLHHGMSCAEALETFRKYNSMTQVWIGGSWQYVTGMTANVSHIDHDTVILPTLALYPVRDGYLCVGLRPMEVKNEKTNENTPAT